MTDICVIAWTLDAVSTAPIAVFLRYRGHSRGAVTRRVIAGVRGVFVTVFRLAHALGEEVRR